MWLISVPYLMNTREYIFLRSYNISLSDTRMHIFIVPCIYILVIYYYYTGGCESDKPFVDGWPYYTLAWYVFNRYTLDGWNSLHNTVSYITKGELHLQVQGITSWYTLVSQSILPSDDGRSLRYADSSPCTSHYAIFHSECYGLVEL